jgi:hydroxymethylpyrimidine/phosphomethylpyrimidine kinase
MSSTTGAPLLDAAGVSVLRDSLLPLAEIVTVNRSEAEALTGARIPSLAEGQAALRQLVARGARAALLKGGHFDGPATDVLYDGRTFTEFIGERVVTRHTHGTGCTLASAIAARLAHGDGLVEAIRAAKAYVTGAIRHAPGLGGGHGPLGHFFPPEPLDPPR